MTTTYIFDPGGANELTLDENDIKRQNPVRTHTGISDLSTTLLVPKSDVIGFAERQDRLNVKIDGTVKWTGFVTGVSNSERTGEIRIRGKGIAKRLEETRPDYDSLGGSLTYSSIGLDEAIRDYWARTPFDNFNVVNQSTEAVAADSIVQEASTDSEFNDIITIADDVPAEIRNGNIELLPVTFLTEAETAAVSDGTNVDVVGDFSNNELPSDENAVRCEVQGDSVALNFTPEYDIPDGQIFVGSYAALNSFDGTVKTFFDGSEVDATTYNGVTSSNDSRFSFLPSVGTLSAGTSHTLRYDVTTLNSGSVDFDFLYVIDEGDRFADNFNISRGGYSYDASEEAYSGPAIFPEEVTLEFESQKVSFNVNEQKIESVWNDTSNQQQLAGRLDSSTTYQTTVNSQTATFDWSNTVSRTVQIRVRLSRFTTDATKTPTNGDTGHIVDEITHKVSGDNRVVIDELELTRNHFDNLKELHEYGNFQWTIEHSADTIANMFVQSYQEGDVTKTEISGFDDPVDQDSEVVADTYFNSIFVQGGEDANGDRPTAEFKDQTEINNANREISPGVLRDPKITTEGGALFRARALLDKATSNNDRKGTVTIPPEELAEPGYAYPVDFGNGKKDKTAEEVTLTENPNNVNIRYRFSRPNDLSEQISELKRQARSRGDRV